MNKKGLGKGLGAIFGDAADPVNTAVEPVRSDEEKKEPYRRIRPYGGIGCSSKSWYSNHEDHLLPSRLESLYSLRYRCKRCYPWNRSTYS